MTGKKKLETVTPELIDVICRRLRQEKPVRRSMPVWGRLHIDRPLPFLCVYRRPTQGEDPGTERLATSEASYLTCSAQRKLQPGLSSLVREVATTLTGEYGACLLLELWAAPDSSLEGTVATTTPSPEFRVVAPKNNAHGDMIEEFAQALSRIRLGKRKAVVRRATAERCSPKGLAPILPKELAAELGCFVFGLEIAPIYRDAVSHQLFPQVLRALRRQLTVALRRAFFQFARNNTTHRPPHYHALGRRAVVKAVWDVDRALAEASEQFDFLLQLTPVNGEQAWLEFKRRGYRGTPTFYYRPLPAEPVVLKRNLYKAPVERVEDPALANLFREKLDEIDRQITLLQDRGTSRFLHGSIQLYGDVEDDLYNLAIEILDLVPPHSHEGPVKGHLTPEQFARRAEEEIEFFRRQLPSVSARVEVRSDISSLMVSRGNLLVSTQSKIPLSRVEALIQHEVGTHVLTYYNGKAQRFRQLYTGLAGYDALQEGLAVLSEYLVDGLSRPRLRLLAGRVVGARMLLEDAAFSETFRELAQVHKFDRRTAFLITMRIYRGGGLTKDAVYLRGLCQILDHLARGGELEPLFVGKIAVHHIPIIRELQWRGVLREPPLVPRYMNRPEVLARLEHLRQGVSPRDLLQRRKP